MNQIIRIVLLCHCGVGHLIAADWPQWGGSPRRNLVSEETGLATKFHPGTRVRRNRMITFDPSTSRNVKWISQLGSKTYSSPVIANGRVFIGTNDDVLQDDRYQRTQGGVLRCLSESNGTLLWQLVVPRLEIDRRRVSEDFDSLNLGICSTPTVDGDCVYVVSNRCEVLCLDVAGMANGNAGPFRNEAIFSSGGEMVDLNDQDADLLWRFDMLRDIPNFPHDAANSCVLVHGNYLYVGTSNGVSYGQVVVPEAPSLIVLDKRTGEFVASDDTFITPNVFHGQWSSPSWGRCNGRELVLYGGGDGRCYAFAPLTNRPAGPAYLREVWSFDANPARYRLACPTTNEYWEFARGGRKGEFSDGKVITPSEIIGTPVLHQGRVYVTIGQDPMHGPGAGSLSCFDAKQSGDITESGCLWRYNDLGRSMATVSIAGRLLFVTDTMGRVHCLDAVTGMLHWVEDLGEDSWASTLVADGKIYVGHRRGLTVLRATREPQRLFDVRLSTRVPSVAVASNGILYVTSRRNLFAVQEKGEMPENK